MERTVTRQGISVELTAKEFALLEYLMQARGRTCLRSELLRDVWQASPVAGTNVVDVYVNYLRKKLAAALPPGTEPGMDRIIETVRGEGYLITDNAAESSRRVPRGLPLVWSRGRQANGSRGHSPVPDGVAVSPWLRKALHDPANRSRRSNAPSTSAP